MSIMMSKMPDVMKPRERLKTYGISKLSELELLSILLRTGTKDISVNDLALNVLMLVETINDLDNLTLSDLMNIKGIKEAKAMAILSALELGKRLYLRLNYKERLKIYNGEVIYNLFKYLNVTQRQENFVVVLLDNKNYLIKSKVIFKGSINESIAHPREIFRFAISYSATYIIAVHNHPSGDVLPSNQDIKFTNNLIKSGKIIGIPVIDHIIIGNNRYYTFKEKVVVKCEGG